MDKALLLLGVDRTKTREHKGNMAWISVQNTWDTVIQIHDILLFCCWADIVELKSMWTMNTLFGIFKYVLSRKKPLKRTEIRVQQSFAVKW